MPRPTPDVHHSQTSPRAGRLGGIAGPKQSAMHSACICLASAVNFDPTIPTIPVSGPFETNDGSQFGFQSHPASRLPRRVSAKPCEMSGSVINIGLAEVTRAAARHSYLGFLHDMAHPSPWIRGS